MICQNCKKEISENALYCPNCGTNVQELKQESEVKAGEPSAPQIEEQIMSKI